MKKRVHALVMIGLISILALAGCGNAAKEESASAEAAESVSDEDIEIEEIDMDEEVDEEYEEESEEDLEALMALPLLKDGFKLEDCVELADYKNLDVTVETEEVTDEDVTDYINYSMEPVEVEDKEATLQNGDTANIDFVGKKDGEAFSGGTSSDYDLEIGSGSFIPGFEEGLIGMKAGESRNLDLTFPEDYGSEELAGEDVVFEVTLNAIKQMPELNDAWVKEYTEGEYETVDAYRESVRKELEEENRLYAESMAGNNAFQQLIELSTFHGLPESYVNESAAEFDTYMQEQATMYGYEDMDAYLEDMGMDHESYESYRDSSARGETRNRLVVEALKEAEGLKETDEDFQEAVKELEENNEMTFEELKETYDADEVQMYVETEVLMRRLIAYNTK